MLRLYYRYHKKQDDAMLSNVEQYIAIRYDAYNAMIIQIVLSDASGVVDDGTHAAGEPPGVCALCAPEFL